MTNTRFLRCPSNPKASRHGCAQDLLPRAKVEATVGDRHDDFAAHNLPLHMRIGVVFPGVTVTVLADRLVRGQLFQPIVIVPVLASRAGLVQAAFVVVGEHTGCDVLCVCKDQHVISHIPLSPL